jgi:ankyrin repeat protein
LESAISAKHVTVVDVLIKAGAPVNITFPYSGSTPLLTTIKALSTDIANLLIQKGADVNLTSTVRI